jgi:hypothetical protein
MATLSVDTPRVFESGHDEFVNGLPMIDNDIIYDGAAVGESAATGTFRPLVSGDQFAGFAVEQADNTVLGHVAGFVKVNVKQCGRVKLAVTGASAVTDVGAAVYATDDNVFTLTPSGTKIGVVARWIVSTDCIVDYDARENRYDRQVITCLIPLHATKVIHNLFVAPYACRVTAAKWTADIAQDIHGTIVKATGTATPASATTPIHTALDVDCNIAAHTVVSATLTSTVADLALVAGQRLALVLANALSTGSISITIELERVRS